MKESFINLLLTSLDDIVYEINLNSNEINWHNNTNDNHKFFNLKSILTYDELLTKIHPEDKNSFTNRFEKKENGKSIYQIKDSYNNYHTWEDNYIYYKDKQEEYFIGVCKKTIKPNKVFAELEKRNKDNILDNSTDLYFYKDLHFRYIDCNKAFSEFVGLPKEEILGKSDFELFEDKYAKSFRSADLKVLKIKKRRTTKEYAKYKCGKEVLFLSEKAPLIDTSNNLYGILGIARDITAEMNYKKELVKSRKSYQKIFEANKIPVLIICPESGNILNANRAALKFYEYSFPEIQELAIHEINILSKKEIEQEMASAVAEQRDCFNFKHKTKTGRIIDVEVYSGPIRDNKKLLLYSIIFDVTKRKKAEEKLNQAHTIYQNTREGIFITDLKGNFLSVNKAFENITGYKENEVKGKPTSILKSNKHSKTFYNSLWNKLLEKGAWEGEIINKTKNNDFIPQWLTIDTVYDSSNKPMNYVAVFTDFSKLKKQEELLREKDQLMHQQSKMAAMGEMLRNIAHQWRQPLSAISSSASGLKLKKEFDILKDSDFIEFTEGILKSTQYLSETIEDFSNYFKNDANKKRFYISEAINKSIQLIEASLKNHDIILQLDTKNDYEILGIKNELVQVLLNIINNAKDAYKAKDSNNNAIIKISTFKEHNNIIIQIQDNAGGINEKIIDKIFEPYFTTKHQSQGTGIGLYMSKKIIQDHFNGTIDVFNLNKKNIKGVEFKILIPTT